ncbi:hypothetical protein [Streptomyces sp. NPDC088725]|uniref:hypothetical protein n=1 Tax=Streptomyces sp. NPDC088725 TaxID=3365873 RepID=UPI0037FEDA1B
MADLTGQGGNNSAVKPSGGRSGKQLTSQIEFRGTAGGSSSAKDGGKFTPAGNWSPPACWYEPRSAKDFEAYMEEMYEETVNYPGQHSYAKNAVAQYRKTYKDGKYKNYNLDKADEGKWWIAVQDPARENDPASWECSNPPAWALNGDAPDVKNAVTPDVLAQLAYNRIQVPDTKVTLAPADTTKVNLSTWAWLDKAEFKPVSVTASLPSIGISATTTATPVSLSLQPGTTDAELLPPAGECPLMNGSIGTPFRKGDAEKTPPCGITYLRATGGAPFELRATVTWKIHWTGTGVPGGGLPDGTFGTAQDVIVEEVQAVNR